MKGKSIGFQEAFRFWVKPRTISPFPLLHSREVSATLG
jgi:hypothetical protein